MAGDLLYGRRARVTISIPVSTPGNFSSTVRDELEVNGTDDPVNPGLRIQFAAKLTLEKEPNTAEITITNLAPTTRSSLQTKGVKVRLEAGYAATGLTRIFSGDARSVDHQRKGADWETLIKCGDGERAFRFARASESFGPGATAGDVLKYLAGAMGLALGNVSDQAGKLTQRFDAGYIVSGSAQACLDRLIKSIGYTWSIQAGAIQVLAVDEVLQASIPELNPESGLIGSPEMGTAEKKGKPALLKFTSLLQPMPPGASVHVKSERYNSDVRIKKCNYDGDTAGGSWYAKAEGVIIRGQ